MGAFEDDMDHALHLQRKEAIAANPAELDPLQKLAQEVVGELLKAEQKHAPMHSPHEGWSVIWEELEELREHVRADTGQSDLARKEAIQIAAMGMRYALNLCQSN